MSNKDNELVAHTDNKSLVERALRISRDRLGSYYDKDGSKETEIILDILCEAIAALQSQQGSIDAQSQPKMRDNEVNGLQGTIESMQQTNRALIKKVVERHAIIQKLKEGLIESTSALVASRKSITNAVILKHTANIATKAQQTLAEVEQLENQALAKEN